MNINKFVIAFLFLWSVKLPNVSEVIPLGRQRAPRSDNPQPRAANAQFFNRLYIQYISVSLARSTKEESKRDGANRQTILPYARQEGCMKCR